jgi:hypothetical protein
MMIHLIGDHCDWVMLGRIVANHLAVGWALPAPSPLGHPLVRLAPLVADEAQAYGAIRAQRRSKSCAASLRS